jgi:four helix bundle protein
MTRPELEQRSARFALDVVSFCEALRSGQAPRSMVAQLLDCATAVGANYRATSRARSRREFVAKMGQVAEEADEAVYWLELIRAGRYGDLTRIKELTAEACELRAIFAASYATARRGNRRRDSRRGDRSGQNGDNAGSDERD